MSVSEFSYTYEPEKTATDDSRALIFALTENSVNVLENRIRHLCRHIVNGRKLKKIDHDAIKSAAFFTRRVKADGVVYESYWHVLMDQWADNPGDYRMKKILAHVEGLINDMRKIEAAVINR